MSRHQNRFILRFFFDAGSGVCFWAGNEQAKQTYGYAIEASELPISEQLWREAIYLCAWFDTSIDWHEPTSSSIWPHAERKRFEKTVQGFLIKTRHVLGEAYEVLDETGIQP